MKRRSLFALLTSVLFNQKAARLLAGERRAASDPETADAIVIGAGLAGLAAACNLQQQGWDIVVLEARDRLGGRLWTSRKWEDLPADLGASWIHGIDGNPLTELAIAAEAKMLETSYEKGIAYDKEGNELDSQSVHHLESVRQQFRRSLRVAQDGDEDQSMRALIQSLAAAMEADEETMQLLNFILSSEIEQEYAGSGERLSTLWHDSAAEFEGSDVLLDKGFESIVKYLSKDLTIHTNEIVERIEWFEESVKVTTNRRSFIGEKVLVTLPLGVLKAGHVEFEPPLPKAKMDAVSKLEMGVLNKCYMRFDRVFWPDDVDWIEYIPRRHGEWTEWVSFARVANKPVLLGLNSGNRGREIEAWSDEQIVGSAMQVLRSIFGASIPEPIDFQVTRWASDPFALGSYSFNPVGAHPRLRRKLAEPLEGKLYFAGEATDYDYFGTAHGAYLSGVRAAREILQ